MPPTATVTADTRYRRIRNALVAYTVAENLPSLRVLEKLGFSNQGKVERKANEAGMVHAEMIGLRYVLDLSDSKFA